MTITTGTELAVKKYKEDINNLRDLRYYFEGLHEGVSNIERLADDKIPFTHLFTSSHICSLEVAEKVIRSKILTLTNRDNIEEIIKE